MVYPSLGKEFKIIDKQKALKSIKKFGIDKKFVLLHGRIIKDKRPDLAIKAFAKTNSLQLVISGTLEEEKAIRDLIKELNIEKKVKIIGRVSKEELVALYNLSSCFLMSSPKEDFGLTPIEAMACGCPVVAWGDGAGPSETVINDINGYLVEPYDLEEFSSNITKLCNKKLNRAQISKSVKRFSQEVMKKQFLGIIEKIIN